MTETLPNSNFIFKKILSANWPQFAAEAYGHYLKTGRGCIACLIDNVSSVNFEIILGFKGDMKVSWISLTQLADLSTGLPAKMAASGGLMEAVKNYDPLGEIVVALVGKDILTGEPLDGCLVFVLGPNRDNKLYPPAAYIEARKEAHKAAAAHLN